MIEIQKFYDELVSKIDLHRSLKKLSRDIFLYGMEKEQSPDSLIEAGLMDGLGQENGMIEVNKDNFEAETSTGTVLLDFSALSCGPCRMLGKILVEVAAEKPDLKICTIDVYDNTDLATKFGVSGIPLLVLLKDGKEVARNVGAMPKAKVVEFVESGDTHGAPCP
jgi:thioredoxin 1